MKPARSVSFLQAAELCLHFFYYYFIFGCVGSSLLHAGFL